MKAVARADAVWEASVKRWTRASRRVDIGEEGVLERVVHSSLADLARSPCILPAAEKTRSMPPPEQGAAKYCLTILAHLSQQCR